MTNQKIWVIAFKDGEDINYWRIENYNPETDDFVDYGEVKTFETKEKAEKFMFENTDSRAFDFYVTEIDKDTLNEYESRVVLNGKN